VVQLVLAGFAGALFAQPAPEPIPLQERSTSASRQFIVYSTDRPLRQGLASLAEETKQAVLGTLRLRDAWRLPVVIVARDAPAGADPRPAVLQLIDVEGASKVQLDLERGRSGVPESVRREIARAVLFEISCRQDLPGPVPEAVALPPAWMVDGTLALGDMRRGSIPTAIYRGFLRAGQIDPVPLLTVRPAPPDSTSAALQRAVAAALVQALLDRPEAGQGMIGVLRAGVDASGSDPVERIFAGYPSLERSRAALAKAWAVQAGRFAAQREAGVMGAAETREALAEALAFEAGTGTERSREGIAAFAKLGGGQALRDYAVGAGARLEQIGSRIHPLWAVVASGYRQVLRDLERGRVREAPQRIAALERLDSELVARADAIDDHLNWLEANAPGVESGAFAAYLRAARPPAPAPKTDAISRYLDSLEREFP